MTIALAVSARISEMADIEISTKGSHIEICDNVFIDSFVKVKAAGGCGNIYIGRNTFINSGSVLYYGNGITIGEDVLIAANCTLAPVNHSYNLTSTPFREQGFLPSKGGIVIGNNVWIGSNTVILDGSVIGNNTVIGACSMVRGFVEGGNLYGGNPLKFIRKLG